MTTFLDTSKLDHGLLTKLHSHPLKDYSQAKQSLQELQREKDDRQDIDFIEEGLITAAIRKLGRNPLDPEYNVYYKLFEENFEFPVSPAEQYERTLKTNKNDSRHIDKVELFPPTKDELETYKAWKADTPLYSPKHIYDMLDVSYSITVFKNSHNLPELLTYKQTVYILLIVAQSSNYSLRKGMKETIKHKLEYSGKHLFPLGVHSTAFRTKVGRVYGTWKFTECLSESENTSNNANVVYRAVCRVCEKESEVNYRYFYKKCYYCRRNPKDYRKDKPTEELKEFDKPILVFLLSDKSISVANFRPADAIAVAKFKYMDEVLGWEYYESRPRGLPHRTEIYDESTGLYGTVEGESEKVRPKIVHPSDTLDPLKLLPSTDIPGF